MVLITFFGRVRLRMRPSPMLVLHALQEGHQLRLGGRVLPQVPIQVPAVDPATN